MSFPSRGEDELSLTWTPSRASELSLFIETQWLLTVLLLNHLSSTDIKLTLQQPFKHRQNHGWLRFKRHPHQLPRPKFLSRLFFFSSLASICAIWSGENFTTVDRTRANVCDSCERPCCGYHQCYHYQSLIYQCWSVWFFTWKRSYHWNDLTFPSMYW